MPVVGYTYRRWNVQAPCAACGVWKNRGHVNPTDTADPPHNYLCRHCLHRLMTHPEHFEDTAPQAAHTPGE